MWICPSAFRFRRIRQTRAIFDDVAIPEESHCISDRHALCRESR
jgi:hypothetical protein